MCASNNRIIDFKIKQSYGETKKSGAHLSEYSPLGGWGPCHCRLALLPELQVDSSWVSGRITCTGLEQEREREQHQQRTLSQDLQVLQWWWPSILLVGDDSGQILGSNTERLIFCFAATLGQAFFFSFFHIISNKCIILFIYIINGKKQFIHSFKTQMWSS